jgi:hypothetical protein
MLLASYATAIALALRLPGTFNAPIMVAGHALLAVALLLKVRELWSLVSTCSADSPHVQTLELERSKYTADAIQAFYRFIWTLFYSEYALLPFL